MNISDLQATHFRNALYNLNLDSGDNIEYAKGVFVGTVSAVMGQFATNFRGAIQILAPFFPNYYDIRRIPDSWLSEIMEVLHLEAMK